LGYHPNSLARSLRRRVTHTIGLLVPDNANPYFAEVARAIEDAGFAEGYSVVLCNSDLSAEKQAAYIDVLLAKQVDGLILASSGLIRRGDDEAAGQAEVARIREAGVPCVVVDRDLGETPVDQVLVDNRQGGGLVGELLVGLGHRRLACIVGPSDVTPSAGRVAGFRQALADHGLEVAPEAVVRGDGRPGGGADAARTLLDRGVTFTAVFAFNDQMAAGAIGALRRAGLRVPEDVSVVGFDDIPYASATFPALTTVAQPIAELGAAGVRLLLDRIARPDAPYARIELPTRLVLRESTGPPKDPHPPDPLSTRGPAAPGEGETPVARGVGVSPLER
ncbi:MAG TPA: substrate-binding domain-containing protein, partial [Thermomicrobiales bacterium]|nr:substrate-binding domain-containing protein [Thermomicrobiales bacterium]